jgi:ribonuclease HII
VKQQQLLQPLLSKVDRFFEITRFEREAKKEGFSKIAGVDEAGRGPLAGPVVAAACILPCGYFIPKINDSKQLSEEEREDIFTELTSCKDVVYALGIMDAFIIDQINILQATLRAMAAALSNLSPQPDLVLIDGHKAPSTPIPYKTIIKGDTLSHSIMAASIIAKVTRDRQMLLYDQEWPQYGFKLHKGYPTPHHLEALEKWGPCPIHRRSYKPVKEAIVGLSL